MTNSESAGTTERVAVVTGGAGASGAASVAALQANGHRVVVIDRTGDIAADLSSEESTRSAAAAVLERYGRCDVFVHCAAVFDPATLADLALAIGVGVFWVRPATSQPFARIQTLWGQVTLSGVAMSNGD